MTGPSMYIGWKSSTGSYVVSERVSSSLHATPSLMTSDANVVSNPGTQTSGTALSVSFYRPSSPSNGGLQVGTSFIWAVSNTVPSSDTSSATIVQHDQAGAFTWTIGVRCTILAVTLVTP